MRFVLVTGTRPQIIKSAPLLRLMSEHDVDFHFVHTGQHYDYELAAQFITEFKIRQPDSNLGVGSGSGVYQLREIMIGLEPILEKYAPDYLIVPGDTNSALAAAITGFKMDIPTCHLESGLRSYDMLMQEEINRRLIDHGSAALFAPTDAAVENLRNENVIGAVYHVGDTMYDVLKGELSKSHSEAAFKRTRKNLGLNDEKFAVLTLHRRENVDFRERLSSIIEALNRLEFKVVFPMHPRTKDRLEKESMTLEKNITVTQPVPYEQMIDLVRHASLLITDSGGLQKEAYLLNTPCLTIRDNTEWIETIRAGANILSSHSTEDIIGKAEMMWNRRLDNDPSVYGDGSAAEKILDILLSGEITIRRSNQVE